ncbi:MAG: hypothetical protein EBZ77_01835 [Chitinophagia bacterium]|nr:hypothetical protein [Chitinophagia bacterium]
MAEEMPRNEKSVKDKRTIGLTAEIWEQLEELAAQNGSETLADTLRRCILLGISAEKERLSADLRYENSQLVNRKLKQRQANIGNALAVLADESSSQEEKSAAIEAIQKGLTD